MPLTPSLYTLITAIAVHQSVGLDHILNKFSDNAANGMIDQCNGDISIMKKAEIVSTLRQDTLDYDKDFIETVQTCRFCIDQASNSQSCGLTTIAWQSSCKCDKPKAKCRCIGGISVLGIIVIIALPVILIVFFCIFGICMCNQKSKSKLRQSRKISQFQARNMSPRRQAPQQPYPHPRSAQSARLGNNDFSRRSTPHF